MQKEHMTHWEKASLRTPWAKSLIQVIHTSGLATIVTKVSSLFAQ